MDKIKYYLVIYYCYFRIINYKKLIIVISLMCLIYKIFLYSIVTNLIIFI